MNTPAPAEDGDRSITGLDIMALAGLALIAAGIGMVNVPLALFVAGVLIYVPAIIGALR
jgi:hypothetical protein|tara:strand:- start:7359 stop:7535 length:177 start_codon:yes stop_codon:yes gene_type:complete